MRAEEASSTAHQDPFTQCNLLYIQIFTRQSLIDGRDVPQQRFGSCREFSDQQGRQGAVHGRQFLQAGVPLNVGIWAAGIARIRGYATVAEGSRPPLLNSLRIAGSSPRSIGLAMSTWSETSCHASASGSGTIGSGTSAVFERVVEQVYGHWQWSRSIFPPAGPLRMSRSWLKQGGRRCSLGEVSKPEWRTAP